MLWKETGETRGGEGGVGDRNGGEDHERKKRDGEREGAESPAVLNT